MKVIFIACSSKKLSRSAKAEDLYISPLFNLSWEYAKKLKPDNIYILSAKYGLVDPGMVLKPYNITLNNMSAKGIRVWADKVIAQMRGKRIDFSKDNVIFLAGDNYRKHIVPLFKNHRVPMKGLGIGKQLKYLKNRV